MFTSQYPQNPRRTGARGVMAPPPPILYPPATTTDESFFTAPTQPLTQAEEEDDTQEDGGSQEPVNPFEHLWGRLVPCNPGAPSADLHINYPTFTIGRNTTNDLIVPGPKISGQHCDIRLRIETDGSRSVLVNDFSSNGTYINGVKVGRGRHSNLQHGDEISLGAPGPATLEADDYRYIFRQSTAPLQTGGGIHSHYTFGDAIGRGSFATVKKVYSRVTSELFACKIIAKSRFAHNPKTKEMFERELSILQNLRHHNITRLIEYFEDEATIFIVMEMVAGGDMLDYIINKGPVPEEQARIWAAQLVDAISYTHRKNITHRDLKPENILLTAVEPRIVKIADFGLAKSIDAGTFLKTMCGTPSYLAPEVVLAPEGSGYDSKVDCWSLGVIMWAMLTNTACFVEDENQSLREKMQSRRVQWGLLQDFHLSAICQDFVKRLIVNDPRNRMNIREARQHPWIRDVSNPVPADFIGSQQSGGSQESQSSAYLPDEPDHDARGTTVTPGNSERMDTPTGPYGGQTRPANGNGIHVPQDSNGDVQWEAGRGGPEYDDSDVLSLGSRMEASNSMVHIGHQSPQAGVDDEFSQNLAELQLETDTVHGGTDGGDETGESFVNTSVGTPPKGKTGMEVDGDSWQVVPPAVATVNLRPVKAPGRPSRNTRASARPITPPRATTARAAPTTQKRKAADFDSDLSPVPPSDSERAANLKDSTGTVRGKGRAGARRTSAGSTKSARTNGSPAVATTTTTSTKRRPMNRISVPPESDDDEPASAPTPRTTTSKKAASRPSTAATRRSSRQPANPKTPRIY